MNAYNFSSDKKNLSFCEHAFIVFVRRKILSWAQAETERRARYYVKVKVFQESHFEMKKKKLFVTNTF